MAKGCGPSKIKSEEPDPASIEMTGKKEVARKSRTYSFVRSSDPNVRYAALCPPCA